MSIRIASGLAIGVLLAWLLAFCACVLLVIFNFARLGGESTRAPASGTYPPSAFARADIPPLYLALYMRAAARFGLDWTILAGIGRVECDHGRDPAPSCTVEGQLNYAGAGGPAQFLVSTWQRYGITASGQGKPDMWNPADAIFSMANYLRASGAPRDNRLAIYAYNHAWWYVADVLAWARRYRAEYSGRSPVPAIAVTGTVERLPTSG